MIQRVEEVEYPMAYRGTRQECDEVSVLILKGVNGPTRFNFECQIELRNSSNGYYWGSFVIEQTDENLEEFKELKEDI